MRDDVLDILIAMPNFLVKPAVDSDHMFTYKPDDEQ
jgi:hypothetical protein